ncbi:MAG TPA: hypothetical protein DIU39_03710 [Flavobacteriales bacterium]|nr:hypothetical protein [Flavobacteriales bacterium]
MKQLLQILILALTMNSCLMLNRRADIIEQNSDLILPDDWREDGGNYYFYKNLEKGKSVLIIIDPASRLLLYRQDQI